MRGDARRLGSRVGGGNTVTMTIVYTIACNFDACTATIDGVMRPAAREHGWKCDTRLGIDLCPNHAGTARGRDFPRGTCAFCGKNVAILKSGLPHPHRIDSVPCPGIHQQVIRGT